MRTFLLPNGFGKTHELVSMMLQPGGEDIVYVAPSLQQADHARRLAERLSGRVYPSGSARFVAARSLRDHPELFRGVRLVVDEADGVLRELIGNVVAIALTPAREDLR